MRAAWPKLTQKSASKSLKPFSRNGAFFISLFLILTFCTLSPATSPGLLKAVILPDLVALMITSKTQKQLRSLVPRLVRHGVFSLWLDLGEWNDCFHENYTKSPKYYGRCAWMHWFCVRKPHPNWFVRYFTMVQSLFHFFSILIFSTTSLLPNPLDLFRQIFCMIW